MVPRCAPPVAALSLRETATALHTPVVISVAAPAPDQDEEIEEPPRWAGPARVLLGVAAAFVLVAPMLIRNRGQALPPEGATPGVLWLLALALAGWLLMPVVLVAAYAHDRHGPLPPRLVLKSLARHPLATLAALLVVPLGLLATEVLVASFVWEQGQLPLMVADLFPPPRFEWEIDGRHLYLQLRRHQRSLRTSASQRAPSSRSIRAAYATASPWWAPFPPHCPWDSTKCGRSPGCTRWTPGVT